MDLQHWTCVVLFQSYPPLKVLRTLQAVFTQQQSQTCAHSGKDMKIGRRLEVKCFAQLQIDMCRGRNTQSSNCKMTSLSTEPQWCTLLFFSDGFRLLAPMLWFSAIIFHLSHWKDRTFASAAPLKRYMPLLKDEKVSAYILGCIYL